MSSIWLRTRRDRVLVLVGVARARARGIRATTDRIHDDGALGERLAQKAL